MFKLKTSRCSKPVFMMISLPVFIILAGQNLPAQTPRLPTSADGITVQYGTATPGIRHELPSNQELGVNINHFIGNPASSHPYVLQESIITRTILSHGDPLSVGQPGAILEYRKLLAVGEMQPGDQTSLFELPDQMFLYIESGGGRLDDGRGYWDLREGITALIPPHAKRRIVNNSDKTLMLLMLTWVEPNGATVRKDILVRDSHALPYSGDGHWSYMSKMLFVPADGMGPTEAITLAFMAPMTIAAPHAHIPHHEELWIKLPPAEKTFLFLGSEVQPMPANVAFLAPVTNTITHSVLNLSDKMEAWIGTNFWEGLSAGWEKAPVQPSVAAKPLND